MDTWSDEKFEEYVRCILMELLFNENRVKKYGNVKPFYENCILAVFTKFSAQVLYQPRFLQYREDDVLTSKLIELTPFYFFPEDELAAYKEQIEIQLMSKRLKGK